MTSTATSSAANITVQTFKDNDAIFQAAFSKILTTFSTTSHPAGLNGLRSLALAGGSTPKGVYKLLSGSAQTVQTLEKCNVEYFFGDVRMVPNAHADSNYKMAHESLLYAVEDEKRIHNFDTSLSAIESSKLYAELLTAKLPLSNEGVPVFDIVMLGCGPDGHTASLFPGTAAAKNYTDIVCPCMPGPDVTPQVERATLTPKTIIEARLVIVLITGESKKWVVDGILSPEEEMQPGEGEDTSSSSKKKSPVARFIRQCKGEVILMVDEAANPSASAILTSTL